MAGTLASASILYVFSAGRVQPYAVGGLGKLWVEENRATIMSNGAGVSESRQTEGSLGYLYGGGVRILLADDVSIRFELKQHKGIEAPSLTRISTSLGYRW